ncbi:MAG: ABC transporter permease, partial [Streptosporangiales bacterium]
MNANYIRLEMLRILRNPQTLIFTVVMPSVLFLVFSQTSSGKLASISASAYIMVSMAAYGSIGAAMFSAARIAMERKLGWNRQLRLTPLPPRAYVLAKGLVAWLVTLLSLLMVYVVGFATGVRMPWPDWLQVLGGTWLATIPFVLLGIGIGYLGKVDLVQPVTMFIFFGMSILGGLWIPVEVMGGVVQQIAELLPSYWLGLAGRAAIGAPGFGLDGVAVLVAWAAVFGAFAAWRYR